MVTYPMALGSIPLALLTLVAPLALCRAGGEPAEPGGMLIDDFRSEDGTSELGTSWRAFSDGVMGGRSEGSASREVLDGRSCIRLRGRVSLANNGGFIQVALPLDPDGGTVDASGFEGIRLVVRGNGEAGYSLHLRTGDTRLPWAHYRAPFAASEAWQEVRIPFSEFAPQNLDRPLDPSRLVRVGIVAGARAFDADVAVARISFYGRAPGKPRDVAAAREASGRPRIGS